MSYKTFKEILEVEIEKKEIRTTADITVRCPKCKLPYTEYDCYDDDWHKVECDRCGTKYKYRDKWS